MAGVKIDPKAVEEFILSNLPGTSRMLTLAFEASPLFAPNCDAMRTIDAGLQRLRRRGKISFARHSRAPTWFVLETAK